MASRKCNEGTEDMAELLIKSLSLFSTPVNENVVKTIILYGGDFMVVGMAGGHRESGWLCLSSPDV